MARPALALALVGLFAAGGAQAQMYKCVGANGQVTYSDAGCPSSANYSDIKAPPIAGPTRRDALAAEARRAADNRKAALVERQRQIEAARPLPGATSLGGPGQQGLSEARKPPKDADRCAGIRYQQRRAKINDPLGHDRSIHAHELARAEREFCGG